MRRLTVKGYNMCDNCSEGKICEHFCDPSKPVCKEKTIYDRLSAYEDIDMEPAEFLESAEYILELNKKLHSLGDIEHLRELVRAEKEGRLVVLPCKTGDTIYQLRGRRHAKGIGVSPRIVSCAHVWSNGDYSLSHQGMTICLKKDLGRTWFLTREEAEATLEMQKDSDGNE